MASIGKQITATALVKSGGTKLRAIVVSSTSSGTYALYDNVKGDNSGELKVNTITPAAGSWIDYKDLYFKDGCSIVIANTLSVTVIFE